MSSSRGWCQVGSTNDSMLGQAAYSGPNSRQKPNQCWSHAANGEVLRAARRVHGTLPPGVKVSHVPEFAVAVGPIVMLPFG